jgi:polar amino acid transport system substrate-binding protein
MVIFFRTILVFVIAFFLSTVGGRIVLAGQDLIRIATEEYPPYTSSSLPHFGIDAHIVREVFGAAGIKVEFEFMPGARALEWARNGQFDATVPWAHRKEREADFLFPDPVIAVDDEYFFHRKDLRFGWNPSKPDYKILKGKAVAAIIGYDYGSAFQAAEMSGLIEVTRVRNLEIGFRMLEINRVDLVISKERVAQYELQKLFPDRPALFSRTREHLSPQSFDYLIISKKSPDARFFVDAFNRGLARLKASGRYSKFLRDFTDGVYSPH